MKSREIAGIYRMVKVEEGPSMDAMTEIPFDLGIAAFAPDGTLSVNQRSGGKHFTYLGDARVEGDKLLVEVRVCSAPSLEGGTQVRTIETHDGSRLVLSGVGSKSGVAFRISWERAL